MSSARAAVEKRHMSEQPLPDLPAEDLENPKVNGATIHVNGLWPFLVWLFGPIRQGGTGMIIALMIIFFGAYELDKLGSPLLEKYGEYIDGQTKFTETVKKGMEAQVASTEAIKKVVSENRDLINNTSAAAITAASDAKLAAHNANESAKQAAIATADVADKLHAAGELMSEVSRRRDSQMEAQTKALVELLETVKESSKNALVPPSTNDGGA
jgi:hypothetical protein